MTKKQKKSSKYIFGLAIGLAAYLISAPGGMVTKMVTNTGMDAFSFSIIRYATTMVFMAPAAFLALFKHWQAIKRHWRPVLLSGLCLGMSAIVYTVAIEVGKASHVSIINLLSPIVLVILSAKIVHDKVSHRATIGIILAAIGGLLVVAMPMFVAGAIESEINPLSVILALVNCLVYPVAMVYMRRANSEGVPMSFILTVACIVTISVSMVLGPIFHNGATIFDTVPGMSIWNWLVMVGYCGIVLSMLVRIMVIKSYEIVGAAVTGGFEYLHTMLAIMLPIIVLHETLSPEILAGSVLILMGVYLTESHHHMSSHAHTLAFRRKARRK